MPEQKNGQQLRSGGGLAALLFPLPMAVEEDEAQRKQTIILPKDIGKDADWPFRLYVGFVDENFTLQVHKDMGRFSLYNIRIPSAKKLIRNREPDNDGVFRIPFPLDYATNSEEFTIEVYGVEPQIWLNRQEGGVEIVWDRGQLQSAPSIDGPWTDITFDDTRRLFVRFSSPAEFFRVKPE